MVQLKPHYHKREEIYLLLTKSHGKLYSEVGYCVTCVLIYTLRLLLHLSQTAATFQPVLPQQSGDEVGLNLI